MIQSDGLNLFSGLVYIGIASEYMVTSVGSKISSQRTTVWTDPINHIFTVTFPDVPTATEFFSKGGQIRFSADRTGGFGNMQNTSFSILLGEISIVMFGELATTNSGPTGNGTAIGYDNLTGSYQSIFTANSSADQYTADEYSIEALINGAELTFKVTMTDDGDNTYDEGVDGTITSYIDERRHNTTLSPDYVTTNGLS
ncbi:MAG: hypothetical protein DRQ60_08695 [Gammaproteobacteria bacterium]|nr:MAG: hypothetical protein DRQ60_08695 [Gammaproteobacteria bacterium]